MRWLWGCGREFAKSLNALSIGIQGAHKNDRNHTFSYPFIFIPRGARVAGAFADMQLTNFWPNIALLALVSANLTGSDCRI
jgi:hypothetical protein